MKNIYTKIALCLLLCTAFVNFASAQCTGTAQYGGAAAPALGGSVQYAGCQFAQEYSPITGIVAGATYRNTSTVATDFFTVRSGSSTGAVIAFGVQPLTWTAPTAGTYYISVHLNAACGTQIACRNVTIARPNPPTGCTNGAAFGSIPAPLTSTFVTISTCIFMQEYSTITGVLANTGYVNNILSGGAPYNGFITIHQGSPAGPIVAAGTQPLGWTSTVAGTYYVHYNTNSACGTLVACFTNQMARLGGAPPPPVNACNSITPMTCTSVNTWSLVGAGGITFGPFTTPGQERIFSFTAPTTGNYQFNVLSHTGGYFVDIGFRTQASGCTATGWTYIDDWFGIGVQGNVALTGGTAYYFIVDDEDLNQSNGSFSIICPSTGPANDLCANAIPILCNTATPGTNVGATIDAAPLCGSANGTVNGVWYTVVGTGGQFTASTCTPITFDTQILVETGACGAFTCITGNDDACGNGLQSSVTWNSVLGTTYRIAVYGFGGQTGTFTLTLTCAAPCNAPPNDLCTGAGAPVVLVGGVPTVFAGTSLCSSSTNDGAFAAYPTVWHALTLTGACANVTVSYCANTAWQNVWLNLATNCLATGPSTFTPAGSFGQTCGAGNTNYVVTFTGLAAGTYYLPVLGNSTVPGFIVTPGPYSVTVTATYTSVGNDGPCTGTGAVLLNPGSQGPFTNVCSTIQSGEPTPPGGSCNGPLSWCSFEPTPRLSRTIWFAFVAPASGRLTLQSTGFDTQLAVYAAGDPCNYNSYILVAANDDDAAYIAHGGNIFSSYMQLECLSPGDIYMVQLDGYAAAQGNATINLNNLPVANPVFSGLPTSICTNAPAVTLVPGSIGGTFSGPGVTTAGVFTAGVAGPGTHTITYNLSACSSSSQQVTVLQAPVATFTGLSSACSNSAVQTLVPTQAGGTFTGPGVTGNTFNPGYLGTYVGGTTTIVYSITSPNGCTSTSSQTIVITAAPNANFSGLSSPYCTYSASSALTAVTAGGTFSGPGVTNNGGGSGTFNPGAAGAGTHVVTYTIPPNVVGGGNYSVAQIPFAPSPVGGTRLAIGDDQVMGPFAIGFPFTFYGVTYTQFYVSSNGFITFSANFNSACCNGFPLPQTNPSNFIAALWTDLYPPGTTTPNGVWIQQIGSTQVISWQNVPYFFAGLPVTVQIIIYSNGTIDIVSTNVPTDSHTRTQGINNASGSMSLPVPGRNGGIWTTSNTAYRFSMGNPCGSSESQTVIVNPEPVFTVASPVINCGNEVSCNGSTDGSATATVTVGNAPITYSWTPSGQNTATASNIGAGVHTVTVTAAGCTTAPQSVTLSEPAVLGFSGPAVISSYNCGHNISCYGASDGWIDISPTGGNDCVAYTFDWTGTDYLGNAYSSNVEDPSGLKAGTYKVKVTDVSGCVKNSIEWTLTQPDELTAITCNNGSQNITMGYQPLGSAIITATPSGGNSCLGYTYSWDDEYSSTTATILVSPSFTTTYTVTITDNGGCSVTATHTVNVIDVRCAGSGSNIVAGGGHSGSKMFGSVIMCGGTGSHGPRNRCVKAKDVYKKLAQGYVIGPCGANYDFSGGDCGDPDYLSCACVGGVASACFTYTGASGATINAWSGGSHNQALGMTWNNVQWGDVICVNGDALSGGKLKGKTFFSVNGGPDIKFYTNCSKIMLNDVQGDLTLSSYTDLLGAICNAGAPPICDCHGKITDLDLIYTGPSGNGVKVYKNSNLTGLLFSNGSMNRYDHIVLNNAAGLPGKIYVELVGSGLPLEQISVKCDKLSVGDEHFYYNVVSWTDEDGTTCTELPGTPHKGGVSGAAAEGDNSLSAYPNPFNDATTVQFTVTSNQQVSVKVYGLTGNLVATLFDGDAEAGAAYKLNFRPETVASGVYIAKMVTSTGVVKTEKLVLSK